MNWFWSNLTAPEASVLVAPVAIISALVSAFISLIVSKRSIYINSVTSERSKWIEKLRFNISEYVGAGALIDQTMLINPAFLTTADYRSLRQKVEQIEIEIKLRLNPDGKADRNIIKIINRKRNVPVLGADGYALWEHLLLRHSQWLLKEEWEKVKHEASGFLTRLWRWPDRVSRRCRYWWWARGKGNPDRLVPPRP